MDLRQLRYFVTIVEQGSFSKAALALHVAQPALSLHVRNMEADFGTPLLFRSPQGVRPTEAGEILARDARALIRQFEATRREIMGQKSEPQGDICVGLPSPISAILGVPLMLEAKRLYPKLRLNVAEGMSGFVLDWLRRGRVDIGLVYTPVDDQKLTSSTVLCEELLLVGADEPPVGCPPIESDRVSLLELAGLPLILSRSGHSFRDFLDSKLAEVGTAPSVIMETESFGCVRPLIEQRVGYSLMTASAVCRSPEAKRWRTWNIGTPSLKISTYVVHGTERPLSGTMRAVVALCTSILSSLAPDRIGSPPAGASTH